jgi:hypothetical protein
MPDVDKLTPVKGERQIWLEPRSLTACVALRGLVEGYSDTILTRV